MLIYLQPLDVDPRDQVCYRCADNQDASNDPSSDVAAERMFSDHESAGARKRREEDNHVAVDAMKNDRLMTNEWCKLEDDQNPSRQDAVEVEHDADLVRLLKVVEAFSWSSPGFGRVWIAEDAIEGEILRWWLSIRLDNLLQLHTSTRERLKPRIYPQAMNPRSC